LKPIKQLKNTVLRYSLVVLGYSLDIAVTGSRPSKHHLHYITKYNVKQELSTGIKFKNQNAKGQLKLIKKNL